MSIDCNICRELAGAPVSDFGKEYEEIVTRRSNIIYESDNLVVIPSLGPLNSSHVMIVPKLHYNSFAEIDGSVHAELDEIKFKIRSYGRNKLEKEYLFFESGAGSITSHAGGCITHAHLHALAWCSDFDRRIFKEIKLSRITKPGFYESSDVEFGYVLYINKRDEWFLCNRPLLPSQFLRYLYALCNNAEAYWNWRRHINISGVRDVIEVFSHFNSN